MGFLISRRNSIVPSKKDKMFLADVGSERNHLSGSVTIGEGSGGESNRKIIDRHLKIRTMNISIEIVKTFFVFYFELMLFVNR